MGNPEDQSLEVGPKANWRVYETASLVMMMADALAMSCLLPKVIIENLETRVISNTIHIRLNKGVVIPNALLAMMLPGVRIGVPAADGVPEKNSGFAGGALAMDCSPVLSSIVTSGVSEDGKSRAGGDDMVG
jgi:hypothetical protein